MGEFWRTWRGGAEFFDIHRHWFGVMVELVCENLPDMCGVSDTIRIIPSSSLLHLICMCLS